MAKNTQPKIIAILDNIRSAHNVGSIFRTADAAGVEKLYLCGYTPRPDQHPDKIAKTALGAEHTVPWEHAPQTWRLVEKLHHEGWQIVALELAPESQNIFDFKPTKPMVLIVGNEVSGISKPLLKRADKIIAIPMDGKKESLNVAVAFGIAVYTLRYHGQGPAQNS